MVDRKPVDRLDRFMQASFRMTKLVAWVLVGFVCGCSVQAGQGEAVDELASAPLAQAEVAPVAPTVVAPAPSAAPVEPSVVAGEAGAPGVAPAPEADPAPAEPAPALAQAALPTCAVLHNSTCDFAHGQVTVQCDQVVSSLAVTCSTANGPQPCGNVVPPRADCWAPGAATPVYQYGINSATWCCFSLELVPPGGG